MRYSHMALSSEGTKSRCAWRSAPRQFRSCAASRLAARSWRVSALLWGWSLHGRFPEPSRRCCTASRRPIQPRTSPRELSCGLWRYRRERYQRCERRVSVPRLYCEVTSTMSLLRWRQREREFSTELESHLELHIADNLRAG